MVYNYYFAVGNWEDRTTLNYTKAGEQTPDGIKVDAYGNHVGSYNSFVGITPPVVHVEELASEMYIKYAGNNVVIKIIKE